MAAPPPSRARAMTFNPPIGEPPAVQFIGVERLAIDRSYQRGTQSKNSQRLIEGIAARWDWRLCTPLLVANREGGLWIIDGQHRWEAAKLRGDIQYLPCAVGHYTGSAEEAALFVAANRHRVRVNAMDMWRAAVASGDEATVTLEHLVTAAGLAIAQTPQPQAIRPGELICTKSLYTAFRIHGGEKVAATLVMIGEAFREQVITYSGLIFGTVLGFFTHPPDAFDVDRLGEALAGNSADEWASHPALDGVIGANPRAAALRKVVLEVMQMLEDDEEAEAA
jgi:hypothetical protein